LASRDVAFADSPGSRRPASSIHFASSMRCSVSYASYSLERRESHHLLDGALPVDDARTVALRVGQRLVGIGQVVDRDLAVRVLEYRDEALLLVAAARGLDQRRLEAELDQRRVRPAVVGIEAVGAALPAHQCA
jgi:hypothetical protein